MRASTSLASFFSSLRSPSMSSHILIPIIQIISPTEPAPPGLSQGPSGIRRWRGARGTLGDLTLQLPSQGLTSGARLALARQGCATGSFRLNCAESLYVKDDRGLAMFQRIELEEELEKAGLGLRERPPMLATTTLDKSTDIHMDADIVSPSEVADRPINKRRPSLRTQRKNILALQNLRFDSGGLSSCVTFSEGLCHLEDYVRTSDSESALSGLPTVHSEEEISQMTSAGDTPKLSWLDSLRKKTLTSAEKFTSLKKRRSASEAFQSISCEDLEISFPEADLTLHIDSSPSGLDDSSHITEDLPGNPDYHLVEELHSKPPGKLRREGSWTRLRRRLSKRLSLRSFSTRNIDSAVQEESLDGSISIATGLFQITQQGAPTSFIQSSIHIYS